MELVDQRADVSWLRVKYAASERRVCGLMTMAVSSYRYRTTRSDEPLRTRLVELAREKPRFGYRRVQGFFGGGGEDGKHKSGYWGDWGGGVMVGGEEGKDLRA